MYSLVGEIYGSDSALPFTCTPAVSQTAEDIRTCTWLLPPLAYGMTFGLQPPGMTFDLVDALPDGCSAGLNLDNTLTVTCSVDVNEDPTRMSITWARR